MTNPILPAFDVAPSCRAVISAKLRASVYAAMSNPINGIIARLS
jgi:hypothetical protein